MGRISTCRQVSSAANRPSASCPPCCIQTSTVSVTNWWPRPSPVYNNNNNIHICIAPYGRNFRGADRPPKLTAPKTISHSRDMVGAHRKLNGSRDLTTPLSGIVCHPCATNCSLQSRYQLWSLYLHSLWKCLSSLFYPYKMSKIGWFKVVKVIPVTRNSTIR